MFTVSHTRGSGRRDQVIGELERDLGNRRCDIVDQCSDCLIDPRTNRPASRIRWISHHRHGHASRRRAAVVCATGGVEVQCQEFWSSAVPEWSGLERRGPDDLGRVQDSEAQSLDAQTSSARRPSRSAAARWARWADRKRLHPNSRAVATWSASAARTGLSYRQWTDRTMTAGKISRTSAPSRSRQSSRLSRL